MAGITFSDITTGLQTVTATGAVTSTSGLDISGFTTDWTLVVRVAALTAAKNCVIAIEDSVNGFTAAVTKAVWNITGGPPTGADRIKEWRKYRLPSLRCGTTSAVARVNILQIDSATTLQIHAFMKT